MRVSVIVRAFNSEKTIGKCLEKILKAKLPKQTEVFVVYSTLSKDNTLNVLKKFNVRIVKHSRKGFGAALNVGVENAKGEILVFCDDDAMASENWLKELLAPLNERMEVSGVSGPTLSSEGTNFFGRCVAALGYPGGGFKRLFEEGFTKHPSMNLAIRKKVFKKVGLFDDDFKYGNEDTDFFIRALKEFKFWFNPKAIVHHKVRDKFADFAKWWFRRGKADVALHKKHMPSFPFSLFSPKHSRLLRLAGFVLVSIIAGFCSLLVFGVWVFIVLVFIIYSITRQQENFKSIKKFLKLPEIAYWTTVPALGFFEKVFRELGRIKGFFERG